MEKNQVLGFILSLAGAVIGMLGGLVIFVLTYEPYMWWEAHSPLAEEGCKVIIEEILPIISDLSIIGGLLFAVAAYGFYTDEEWSVSLAVVGNTLCLLAGFWPTIPAMQMGLVPIWGIIFLPNLVIFLVMTHYVEGIPWITVIFALLTGIAYVMCFLNGVASTNRMKLFLPLEGLDVSIVPEPTITIHAIFRALQRVSWASAIGWGIVTIGILRRPNKDWVRILALASGILAIITGYPVALASSLSFGKFSMFFMAPILSTLLVVVPLFPRIWNRLVVTQEAKPV
ncbi:MAG: hypothetical protein JSV04_13570 [Candidatus Heimdallarchaeota archaeon]|nr:MAG: hypothetical protein JSV04_13570 [Candidatus Heimdallarchaeota archaeon]